MASGSFSSAVGAHWRLLVEWSSTPDVANNRSSVTVNFYWEGLTQYSAVYASSSNSGGVSINGSNQTFTATSGLNAYQKKLLHSRTLNVTHDSDGSKKTTISCNYDINATLAGTYYGNRSLSREVTLDNIPRKSTLTSSASWTAGNNRSISISRASSSFTHTIQIYVPSSASSPIKTITGIGTSTTASFTTAENKAIFQAINGGDSTSTRIRLTTYSGSTNLGYNDYTGTVSAPNASYVNSSRNFNIGDSLYISVSRANSSFTHTIRIKVGSTTVATLTGVGYSTTWNPTSTQNNTLYNATPNSNSLTVTFDVETFYDGVKVKTNRSNTGTATVTNSDPTFSSSNFTYVDSNSATVAITGDNKQLIEGHSTLSATLSSLATARNGASMSKYVITVGGLTAERTTTGTTAMGKINSGSNQTMTIEAIDSRGNSTKATQTVLMIPYSKPSLSGDAYRVNNFGTDSRVEASGSFSRLLVGGVQKNSIVSLQYRQRVAGGTWGSWTNIAHTTSSGTFSGSVSRTLVITTSYEFEIQITDKLDSAKVEATVTTGQPILFLEADRWAVGIGKLPDAGYQLDVQGNTRILGNLELVSSSTDGYMTFERTSTYLVKWDIDLGWGGFGVRNMTDNLVGFHVARNGNMAIGTRASSHKEKLTVHGNIQVVGQNSIYWDYPTSATHRPEITAFNTSGRELLALRGREGGTAGGSIYLYSDQDPTFPQQVRVYSGGDWTAYFDAEGLAIGSSSVLRTNRIRGFTSSERINLGTGNVMVDHTNGTARWQRDTSNYVFQNDSEIRFYIGGSQRHTFRSDGTKSGGSIEVDGENLGMSPIDSPQTLLEYIEFDVPLNESGVRVYVDETYLKTVDKFSVFPNNGRVLEKTESYFVIAGEGYADCRIIGERIEYNGMFYADLTDEEEEGVSVHDKGIEAGEALQEA